MTFLKVCTNLSSLSVRSGTVRSRYMLDSSRFTKLFMTMGNNWLIHALLLTVRVLILLCYHFYWELQLNWFPHCSSEALENWSFCQKYFNIQYFSSNSSFSPYMGLHATPSIFHQCLFSLYLSHFLTDFNTTCITVYPMHAVQVHQWF